MHEPYHSVGLQFSADGWAHAAADVLRGKLQDADLAQAAAEALHMMARRRAWMRCWALYDVLPVLVYLSKVRRADRHPTPHTLHPTHHTLSRLPPHPPCPTAT